MLEPLIYVRAVHFASTVTVAGVVFFVVFIAAPAFRRGGDIPIPAVLRSRLAGLVWASLALTVISGAAWLILTAAAMSGDPITEVFSDDVLATVLLQTRFGSDWLVRSVAACLLGGLLIALLSPKRAMSGPLARLLDLAAFVLAAALIGTLAWAGHAAGGLGLEAVIHPGADFLHLVAAAAWVGTLLPLALLFGRGVGAPVAILRVAALRYSTLGIVSVGTLIATGAVNTWYLAGSIPALVDTDYGRLLLAKVALFVVMIAIAAVNRLRLTPRLVHGDDAGTARAAHFHLRRNIIIEIAIGAAIIAIVAVLGTDPPGIHSLHGHGHGH